MVHALVVRVNNERKSITLQYTHVPFTDMHSWESNVTGTLSDVDSIVLGSSSKPSMQLCKHAK